MLEIKDLSINFEDFTILKNINLKLENQVCVILGPNGSGKTTLLRAISGIIPYKGSIKINGKEVRSAKRILEYSTNLQEVYTIGNSAWDTAKIIAEIKGGDLKEFTNILSYLDVDRKVIHKPIYKMSTGQRSLVSLALALFMKPQIVTIDEPIENVDVNRRDRVISLLRERVNEGLIVTHQKELIKMLENNKKEVIIYTIVNGELVEGDKM
ncbi:ATP-binding cassette domain-containing protein [Saccharolobus islandicus]|uniref:High-affinity zinc uptake, ATP-binding protein n=1 Tax=Saccharolobus islandicus (strain REY15A) TaxID=930945 RepID=F0NHA5_SACI5|nr:ATP-binding cassette domain-containing protein [Sulfolobus islandicus]ADX84904.1 high-affinity zinc uptake, ATP-binding protein [Sulfolobus islandicus REY15A]